MKEPMTSTPILDLDTLKAIDVYLEDFYPQSRNAGKRMADAGLGTSQIRGLETIITSTTRFSEIINHIKNQAGKDKKKKWSGVASLLLEQLETLEAEAHRISKDFPTRILDIKLRLARGWAKQVVTHYLYVKSLEETGR
jgi:hypothetical protein